MYRFAVKMPWVRQESELGNEIKMPVFGIINTLYIDKLEMSSQEN